MKSAGARGITRSRVPLIAMLALAATLGLAGCDGDDGSDGAAGPAGPSGPSGPSGPTGPGLDPITSAKPESCGTCHSGVGTDHQDIYREYKNAKTKSAFRMTILDIDGSGQPVNVTRTNPGVDPAEYTVALEFKVERLDSNGINFVPFVNDGLASLDQQRFIVQRFFAGNAFPFQEAFTQRLSTITNLGAGNYTASATKVKFDPLALPGGAQAYAYIAEGVLETEGMTLYTDVADVGWAFGDAADPTKQFVSAANVDGCEACHGDPYLKHGYRAAVVSGLTDFAACKECHFDDRKGSHLDWQQMVDEPFEWATGVVPDPVRYAYKASTMQDTHMSHAMEFPYPMSMANCVACHKGQERLDRILADSQFKPTTCKSCHPVQGTDAWKGEKYFQEAGDGGRSRAPAINEMWTTSGVQLIHASLDLNNEAVCLTCHKAASQGGIASTFKQYHSGYEAQIYDANGQRYSDLAANKITIEPVALTGNVMDIKITSPNVAIIPELAISFYGYDSKNMLVSSHTRDGGEKTCYNDRAADPLTAPKVGCRYEIAIDGNPVSELQTNRLFTIMPDSVPGAWHVQADLSKYVQPANSGLADIPALITAGTTKRAEVIVLPDLEVGGVKVALSAQSKTFDLAGKVFVDNWFKGTNAVVSEAKCNACHDALGTTFHTPGWGGNIVACRSCHVTTSGGAHLEMQSRGIDSYIHAIHKFQAFDIAGIDFTDPVFAKRYALHVEHTFPNFTIKNCESCHVTSGACTDGSTGSDCTSAKPKFPVVYNVPDQSQSMPGLETPSATLTKGWVNLATGAPIAGPRNIGGVPSYVVGPANRACGGCHRAVLINEDDAGALASFNSHTDMGGYLVENDSDNTFVYKMIEHIMSMFE